MCRHAFCAEYLIEQGADPFIQDRGQHRSAIHYAAAKGKAGALRKLLSDHLCIHTDEGFVPLKSARIQDVSGNCRYTYCSMTAPLRCAAFAHMGTEYYNESAFLSCWSVVHPGMRLACHSPQQLGCIINLENRDSDGKALKVLSTCPEPDSSANSLLQSWSN